MTLRILLVDDHALFRSAVRMHLELERDLIVVAEAQDADAALRHVADCRPQVACVDVALPGLGGAELTRALLAQDPTIRVIGLSAQADPLIAQTMLVAGALAYVDKLRAGTELATTIRRVATDQTDQALSLAHWPTEVRADASGGQG